LIRPWPPNAKGLLKEPFNFIEVSQIILQEADQPDLVIDLAYGNGLASNGGANSGADIRIWNLME